MINIFWGIGTIGFCVVLHAFFAACEMGIVSLNRLRLRHKLESGDKIARIIMSLLDNPEKLFGTILVGMNICVILASTIMTVMVRQYLTSEKVWVAVLSTIFSFPLFILFGEIIPKTIARNNPGKMVPVLIRPLRAVYWLLLPVVFITTRVSRLAARLFTHMSEEKNPFVTREELKMMVKEEFTTQKMHANGKNMIYRIFDLEETTAREVMVPLIDIVAIQVDKTPQEAIFLMQRSGYSRLPVYQDRIDNMIGIVLASDLLGAQWRDKKLMDLLKPAYLVPETKPIDDILREMQTNQRHMAIVVDEYGGVSGILTNEDIIEEIVGEIEDEYDRRLGPEVKEAAGMTIVEGKMRVEDFEASYQITLPETDAETLAGLLMSITNTIPRTGDKIAVGEYDFEILSATDRKVAKIGIKGLTRQSDGDTKGVSS